MEVMLGPASRRLGRYELVSYLGSGGMSDVYVALHMGLRKRVALKMLRASLRSDPAAVQRFLREGECAARVSHPNVVDVSDVGTDNGVPYLVMELLEGETLADKLAREGPLGVESAVDILLPILDALATAHASGVLHRDVKPANILLARTPDGSVKPKLVDFGIAELSDERSDDRRGPVGTPHYMSPEQARGEALDHGSDQYSVGSVLFEMLTGREPFRGGGVEDVLDRVARGDFPSLEKYCTTAPRGLAGVLARMTAPRSDQRYPTIVEASRALVPFASARTQRLWISHDRRRGLFSAQLLSGSYHAERGELSPRSVGPRASYARRRAPSPPLRAFVGGLGLVLGIVVGFWISQGEAAANRPDSESLPGNAEGASAALANAAEPRTRVSAIPRDAVIRFDGEPLGRGAATLPPLGDRLHELRVEAPGYVDRVILFHGKLDETTFTLELRN